MYGKTFASMYEGSMCGSGYALFAVWNYVIANADPDGMVTLNPMMMAVVFNDSVDGVRRVIGELMQPHPESTNQDEGGRRLVHRGGMRYWIVSHAKYRAIKREADRREYERDRKREQRARPRDTSGTAESVSGTCPGQIGTCSPDTDTEANTSTDAHAPKAASVSALTFPLKGRNEAVIPPETIAGWEAQYPRANVIEELKAARTYYSVTNPSKMPENEVQLNRAITAWLSKSNDSGGGITLQPKARKKTAFDRVREQNAQAAAAIAAERAAESLKKESVA